MESIGNWIVLGIVVHHHSPPSITTESPDYKERLWFRIH